MSYIFKMPAVGEGITEGEIAQWDVKVGDSIKVDETIVEIQNDKLVQEVPSPVTGTITKILVEAGTVVQVGEPLAELDAPGFENEEPLTEAITKKEEPKKEETKKEETKKAAPKAAKQESSNYIFKLPKVGEGIAEGEIAQWDVAVGDTVAVDQTLLEVSNDKLVQEVPSPVAGVIKKILVEAGTVAQIGEAIAEIAVEGQVEQDDTQEETEQQASLDEVDAAPQAQSISVSKTEAKSDVKASGSSVVAGRVLAMPSVRQLARDMGINISEISGTGKHGHITKSDVESFDGSAPAETTVETIVVSKEKAKTTTAPTQTKTAITEATAVAESERTTREKMTPIRRAIASAMVNSKAHAPHVTIFDDVEVSKLMNHRKKYKEVAAEQDISLTFLAYMTKAVVTVLRKYPILNASVDETTDEIVYKNYYNLGLAVDTDKGLFVPNIKDADRKGMFTIAQEITELATKAHEGKLTGPEMSDGSTTISNIGSARGMWFTPIINYPEVAIFGMGRIEKKPVVQEDGTVGVGSMLYLSMSFDHRVVDGALAQKAMNELKRLMADPELLLMEG